MVFTITQDMCRYSQTFPEKCLCLLSWFFQMQSELERSISNEIKNGECTEATGVIFWEYRMCMRWRWSSLFGPQPQQNWRTPQPGCPQWAPSPGQTSTPSAWQHSSIWRYWRRRIWSEHSATCCQTFNFNHEHVIKSNELTITREGDKSLYRENFTF